MRLANEVRQAILSDLAYGQKLFIFLANNSRQGLALHFNCTHTLIRKAELGLYSAKAGLLTPEDIRYIQAVRRVWEAYRPEARRYSMAGIARHHKVAHYTVRRIRHSTLKRK
jgi:hypothetical protein